MPRKLSDEEIERRERWVDEQVAKGNGTDADGVLRAAREWMDTPVDER